MPFPCARCDMPQPKRPLAENAVAVCTLCGAENRVHAFPAILQEPAAATPSEAALEGEAACFDHPSRRAIASCGQCGRFVCAICSVKFSGETWCPTCTAAGAGVARRAKAETSRTLYDSIVFTLPLASLPVWPFTLATAPAALVLGLLKWNQPLSLVRRTRWRMAAGMLIASIEIGAWVWGLMYFLNRMASTK